MEKKARSYMAFTGRMGQSVSSAPDPEAVRDLVIIQIGRSPAGQPEAMVKIHWLYDSSDCFVTSEWDAIAALAHCQDVFAELAEIEQPDVHAVKAVLERLGIPPA